MRCNTRIATCAASLIACTLFHVDSSARANQTTAPSVVVAGATWRPTVRAFTAGHFSNVDANGGEPQGADVVAMLESNLAMLESNLATFPARVLSPAGREIVGRYREELAKFLRQLRREISSCQTL